ncbi:MAG TPA: SRPBCC family protein [Gammaproteobacteria bacterium]|jgi:hypothetical protein|nr:SRPBCC family protein [Gammaproteobacteria bacterium]
MNPRRAVLPLLIGACCAASGSAATLRSVQVSQASGRYHLIADTHLDAPPAAIYQVLLDFDHDRYQRISEIYKESSYLPPDSDGTPLVYTRVEGCLLFFCRSLRRVERLEVATPNLIRTEAVPDRSDFKYAVSEWRLDAEGTGTKLTYRMDLEPSFWLPPFVGPWFLKRTLLHGAPSAVDKIEALAQQVHEVTARADAR